ncbi:hypothetical protein ACWFR1_37815 [Streptomyces sp. NPDC055103]
MSGYRPYGDPDEEGRAYETHIHGEVRGVVAPGGIIGSVYLGDDSYAERMRLVALDSEESFPERYKAAEELIPYGRRYRDTVIVALNGVLEEVKSMEMEMYADPPGFNALGGWQYAVAAQLEVVGEKASAVLAYEDIYHRHPGFRSQATQALTRLGEMQTLSTSRSERAVRMEAWNNSLYCSQRMAAVVEWMSMPKGAVHAKLAPRVLMAAALWDAVAQDWSNTSDDKRVLEAFARLVPERYAEIEKSFAKARALERDHSRRAQRITSYRGQWKPPWCLRNWTKALRLLD